MVCPNCGNQINTVSNTCPFCNTPLQYDQGVSYEQYDQQQQQMQQQMQYDQQQMQYDQNYYQQPMPTYVQQAPPEIIKPKNGINIGSLIFKIIGSLISFAILCVVILFLTTRHMYCTQGSKKVLVLYTNSKLLYCLSTPKEECEGFNNVKDLGNESNISTIMDSLKEYYIKEGADCKLR
jgi:hypothetical protein